MSIFPFSCSYSKSQWIDKIFCWYLPAISPTEQQYIANNDANSRNDNNDIELIPVHSPLRERRDGQSLSNHQNPQLVQSTTWLYYLQHNPQLYEFAIWCAITYPLPNPHPGTTLRAPSHYTESQIRWRQRWVIFCHFCSILHVFIACSNAISLSIANRQSGAGNAVQGIIAIASIADILPVITIMPAIFIFKQCLSHSLCKPKDHYDQQEVSIQTGDHSICSENDLTQLSTVIVDSIVNHAIALGQMVLCILLIVPFLLGLIQFVSIAYTPKITISWIIFYLFNLLGNWTMIPPTAMLIGILTFLVMDQRYSYYMLLEMRQKALSNEVIDTVYLSIGKRLEERDANSPLNFIVGVAIIVIVLCTTTLLFYNIHTNSSLVIHIMSSLLLVYIGVKEIVILLIIIYYMRKVNDMADQLLHQVNRRMSTDIKDDKLRQRRIELLLIMKDYRIGSTVFYQRPSTTQLMVQFLSLVAAVLSAVGKVIFNAIS